MSQLYVGNLSAEGDEKAIRILFGKYGNVREVLMKNGYAFVEYDSPVSADDAMRDLNGTDILGHPMIVEPAHQQRPSARRKSPCGRVEVTDIPHHLNVQAIEGMFGQFGQVHKMEIEEGELGMRKVVVTFETQEQAQRAAGYFGDGSDHTPRVTYLEGMNGIRTVCHGATPGVTIRKGSPGLPTSPSKNSDFPLRILVPNEMVGAIIGKDGATIRMITQITKARVDVHRRENMGTAEKVWAVTIIGPPECCTEACHQIMKIMQTELLMTNGMMEAGKFHEPLPVVPLKVLAHNELIGRVIGKGGNTLKRIMAESGTKITISKLKELTTYNMERTITILGTIDNCKKAESLISAKLRASYESDMAQFIPASEQGPMFNSPSPTNAPTPPLGGPMPLTSDLGHLNHAQSLPATPTATNVRTFTDFSGEHTRLTTLHGSAGALEVNNLGGFKLGPMSQQMNGSSGQGDRGKYSLELSIDGMVGNGHRAMNGSSNGMSGGFNPTNGMNGGAFNPTSSMNGGAFNPPNGHMTNGGGVMNGLSMNGHGLGGNPHISDHNQQLSIGHGLISSKPPGEAPIHISHSSNSLHRPFVDVKPPPHSAGPLAPQGGNFGFNSDYDDEISDVFSGLSFKDPPLVAAPGYGRSRLRRSSAPVGMNGFSNGGGNGYGLWGAGGSEHQLPGLHEGEDDENTGGLTVPRSNSGQLLSSGVSSGSSNGSYNGGWGVGNLGAAITSSQPQQTSPNIWFGNRSHPESVTSGYSSSDQSSLSGFSPIYSPTTSIGFGFTPTSRNSPVMMGSSSSSGLLTSAALSGEDRDMTRSPFKASVPTPLTTVTELGGGTAIYSTAHGNQEVGDEDDLFKSIASATLSDHHPSMVRTNMPKW